MGNLASQAISRVIISGPFQPRRVLTPVFHCAFILSLSNMYAGLPPRVQIFVLSSPPSLPLACKTENVRFVTETLHQLATT